MEKSTQLPKTIKLFNFAKKEVNLHGEYKIANVPRVSDLARNTEDNLKVNLSFHLENGKTPCVKGIINSKIGKLTYSTPGKFSKGFDASLISFFVLRSTTSRSPWWYK